jgi:glycerol-3-phosphate acyltransferase PlsY
MLVAVLVLAAYLCGSLPMGVWFGRLAGVDVRRTGSGNIGATNVARTAGLRPALLTLAGDVAKGFVPTVIARGLLVDVRLVALVAVAAFFGHIFSAFLGFSGGKGVATGFGVFLALVPGAALLAALVFAAVAGATRYVSLASVLAAVSLPVATVALGAAPAAWAAALIISATIVFRHRENLSRLRRGVEPRFQRKL